MKNEALESVFENAINAVHPGTPATQAVSIRADPGNTLLAANSPLAHQELETVPLATANTVDLQENNDNEQFLTRSPILRRFLTPLSDSVAHATSKLINITRRPNQEQGMLQ